MIASRFQAVNPFGQPFTIHANPTDGDSEGLGPIIRFTADGRTRTVYCWNFNEGHHSDASHALKLNDKYSSPDFLTGAAEKTNGKYVLAASDFFASFKGKILKEDREFLTQLFDQDWSWVDQYIEVTEWLHRFRESLRL